MSIRNCMRGPNSPQPTRFDARLSPAGWGRQKEILDGISKKRYALWISDAFHVLTTLAEPVELCMSDRDPTNIIPFPLPTRRERAEDPGARLRAALAALDAALEAQRHAVADWRTALHELRGTMGALGRSLHGYRNSLGELGGKVAALEAGARRLEARADAAPGAGKG
jgi:hypothetical protein